MSEHKNSTIQEKEQEEEQVVIIHPKSDTELDRDFTDEEICMEFNELLSSLTNKQILLYQPNKPGIQKITLSGNKTKYVDLIKPYLKIGDQQAMNVRIESCPILWFTSNVRRMQKIDKNNKFVLRNFIVIVNEEGRYIQHDNNGPNLHSHVVLGKFVGPVIICHQNVLF